MMRSVLFWYWQISQRATIPGWYLLDFFTFLARRNSFWGALPSTVSQSFFLASSSLADIDGLTSRVIWANCWVGDDSGNLPTSPKFPTSTILFSISLGVGGASTSGAGGSTGTGGSDSAWTSTLVLTCWAFLTSPILSISLVLAILEKIISQSEALAALQESHDICFELISMFF